MFNPILQNYLSDNILSNATIAPLDVAQIMIDHNVYLLAVSNEKYAIVETDYLSNMPGIVTDIEHTFNVRVQGWCIKGAHGQLMPCDVSDEDTDETQGKAYDNYKRSITELNGMRYGVLKIKQS